MISGPESRTSLKILRHSSYFNSIEVDTEQYRDKHICLRRHFNDVEAAFKMGEPIISWLDDQLKLKGIYTGTSRYAQTINFSITCGNVGYYLEPKDIEILHILIPKRLASMTKLRWHDVDGFKVIQLV